MTKPEELSIPALAIYTELRDRGELIPEDEFSEEFPDVDYWAIVEFLKNEGLHPEPASIFRKNETRDVLFQARTARPMRIE
ncbi:hypothetical protein AB0945_18870 [Streptomyces sp. NPDC005474]|uniref:hypothetical protein n=1 Tax=Streptomyces sp. NPDC005474 TaxID=3154878 RepID=UPI003455C667